MHAFHSLTYLRRISTIHTYLIHLVLTGYLLAFLIFKLLIVEYAQHTIYYLSLLFLNS